MDSLLPPDATEMAIGAVLIAFHAFGRYNTPESNRGSTTLVRFLACWLLYAASLVVIYWLVTVLAWTFPEIVAKLLEIAPPPPEAGDLASLLRSPITTALLFTSLLPNFPLLRRLDRRLLQFFWDLGEIPAHAVKLAHRMYRSQFNIHPALVQKIERKAAEYDIDLSQHDLKDRDSPIFIWAVVCSLILEIERWSEGKNPRYKRFLETRAGEFEDIKAEYATFSSRVSSYYRHLGKLEAAASDVRDDLLEEQMADGCQRLMRVCKLLAHATLSVGISAAARTRTLEALGFEFIPENKDSLSAVQLLQLVVLIMSVFLGISAIRYLPEGALDWQVLGEIVFFAALMSINYGISAFSGVYPKTRWRFADIEITGRRPWSGYLCSAAVAGLASLVMITALRFTRYNFDGASYDESFDKLLVDLSWSYPYLLLSLVIGFAVALITDNGHDRWSRPLGRPADALVMGAVVTVTAVIVYAALHGLYPFEGTKLPRFRNTEHSELVYFAITHLIIGAVIGWFVPQWYRDNRYRTPLQRVIRFVERNGHELRVEAGHLQPGELKRAVVISMAAITLQDGAMDGVEREAIRRCLAKLAEYDEIVDFTVDAAMQEAMEHIQKWQEDNRGKRHPPLDAVAVLRGQPKLSQLLVRMCAAVGQADGIFGQFEESVIEELIRTLGLDVQTCWAGCGLDPRRAVETEMRAIGAAGVVTAQLPTIPPGGQTG